MRDSYLRCRVRNRTRGNTPIHPMFLCVVCSFWRARAGGFSPSYVVVWFIEVTFC